jgi:hypothetical protein
MGKIVLVVAIALVAYAGFVAAPERKAAAAVGDFDAQAVAANEIAAWQAAKAHEHFSVFFSLVSMEREQHQYTWFRAAQAAFYLSRATEAFTDLHSGYERVLPDLEEAAAFEKDSANASFDPAAVARAQLDGWVAQRMPRLNSVDSLAGFIAKEYGLRYQLPQERVMAAATLRAEAVSLADQGGADPDWKTVTTRLTGSYEALHGALQQERTRKSQGL